MPTDLLASPAAAPRDLLSEQENTSAPNMEDVFSEAAAPEVSAAPNVLAEFSNEVARGALTATESSVAAASGAMKAVKNLTGADLNGGGFIERANASLKKQIEELPQSDNPFVSIPANLLGAAPVAAAQFIGSGGPAGFIGRSALLGAAEAYNKQENLGQAVAGGIAGGAVAGAMELAGPAFKMAAKALKEKGPGFAKAVLKQQTTLSDAEIDTAVTNIDQYNLNPFKTRNEYPEAKKEVADQLSEIRSTNKEILKTRESQLNEEITLAKDTRKTSLLAMDATRQETLDNLRLSQQSQVSAGTEAVAENISKVNTVVANAKDAAMNELQAVLGGAVRKIDLTTKALREEINSAMTVLDASGTGFVPQDILAARIAPVKNMPEFKDLFSTSKTDEATLRKVLPADSHIRMNKTAKSMGYADLATLLKEGDPQTLKMLTQVHPAEMKSPEIASVLNTLSETGQGYKDTALALKKVFGDIENASATGRMNIRNVEELKGIVEKAYESAGTNSRQNLLSALKKAITPTNIYRDAESLVKAGELSANPVAHLKPLAEANLAYSQKIDALSSALKQISDDNKDIKVDRIFSAFETNNKYQQAKLLQIEKALPESDKLFSKLKDIHASYKKIQATEVSSTNLLKAQIRSERNKLNQKYMATSRALREERANAGFAATKADKAATKAKLDQLEATRQQKQAEYDSMEEELNKRLNYLKIEDALTRTTSQSNPILGYIQRHAVWSSVLPAMSLHNPVAAIPGGLFAGAISPVGTAHMIRAGKTAIKGLEGVSDIAQRKALKSLVASRANTAFNQ